LTAAARSGAIEAPPPVDPTRANLCRRYGRLMGWLAPAGVVFANGEAEHHECRVRPSQPGLEPKRITR
jgi:hypothetical protein